MAVGVDLDLDLDLEADRDTGYPVAVGLVGEREIRRIASCAEGEIMLIKIY